MEGATQAAFSLREMLMFSSLVIAVATGGLFWAVKWLMDRYSETIAEQFGLVAKRFDSIDQALKKDQEDLLAVERSVMQLKADLPLHYLRKEDAIRHEAVFNAKLDALASKIDNYAGRQDGSRKITP